MSKLVLRNIGKNFGSFRAVDDLQLLMGFKVQAFVADPNQVDRLLKKHYSKTESVVDVVQELGKAGVLLDVTDLVRKHEAELAPGKTQECFIASTGKYAAFPGDIATVWRGI